MWLRLENEQNMRLGLKKLGKGCLDECGSDADCGLDNKMRKMWLG